MSKNIALKVSTIESYMYTLKITKTNDNNQTENKTLKDKNMNVLKSIFNSNYATDGWIVKECFKTLIETIDKISL